MYDALYGAYLPAYLPAYTFLPTCLPAYLLPTYTYLVPTCMPVELGSDVGRHLVRVSSWGSRGHPARCTATLEPVEFQPETRLALFDGFVGRQRLREYASTNE